MRPAVHSTAARHGVPNACNGCGRPCAPSPPAATSRPASAADEPRQDAGQLRDQYYYSTTTTPTTHLDPVVRRFEQDDQATEPGSGDSSVLTLLFPCIRLSRDGVHKVVRLRRSY